MQDIHSIGSGGGVGRLFGGGGGGERLLKPHHHHHQAYGNGHQALKCPRCESLNTKFCYYNNYNLSQPRHFCKGCRRYWTKGGVLRNVPVGGGCRKTKRSKQKSNNSNPSSDAVAPTCERKSSDSQNSGSNSSSLTANTTAAMARATATETKPMTVTEVLSGSNSTNSAAPTLFNFQESSADLYNVPQSSAPNQSFDLPMLDQCSTENNHMFPEIGTIRSFISSSSDQLPLGFNPAPEISSFMHQQGQVQVVEHPNTNQQQRMLPTEDLTADDVKMQMDQTAQLEYSRTSNGGLAAEDWQGGAEEALFDLTGTIDQSYWSQIPWNNHDHQLNYFP